MLRTSLQIAFALTAALLPLHADQTDSTPVPSRTTLVEGITIAPVPNAPFSATVVIELQRQLGDGSVLVRRTINLIARDSKGRIHNERRRLMPESFHGSPPLLEIHLYDPQTRVRTTCTPSTHTARQQTLPQKPEGGRISESLYPSGVSRNNHAQRSQGKGNSAHVHRIGHGQRYRYAGTNRG